MTALPQIINLGHVTSNLSPQNWRQRIYIMRLRHANASVFLHQITIISHDQWLFSSNPTDSEQAGMHVNEYVGRFGLTKQWAALCSWLCSPRLCTAETSIGQRWTAYVRLHVGNSSSGCRLTSASANHQHLCGAYYGPLWSPSVTAQFKCGNWITCGFYQGGNHALSVKKSLTWALDSKACTWLGSKVTTCWLGVWDSSDERPLSQTAHSSSQFRHIATVLLVCLT